jgi:hypothetical protein
MSNYTEEQTKYMIEVYSKNPERGTVELLAQELDKSTKSIIGKLSREGVYRRESYVTKTGEKPITKVELVASIADSLGVSVDSLEGLEKTPKGVLKLLSRELG